jgi:hypothetical protein
MAAVEYYTWQQITDMAEDTPKQPNERSSEALKHYRDLAETPVGVPNGIAIIIRLADAVAMIRKVNHGALQQFTFSADEHVPWSWPQMLVSLGDATGRKIVGPGVVSLSLYERPGSYDHHRAYAGQGAGVTPPIWDWLVVNADGHGWLLHPRWTKRKWEVTPLEDAAALLGTVPAKGVGRSDGRGTYRRATATYAMIAPAEAGDPRPMQGIPPPPPPPPEVAPAEAGQAFAAAPATAKAWLDAGVDGSSAAATPAEDSTRGGGAGICSTTGGGGDRPVA